MSVKKMILGTMVASQLVTAQMAQAFTVSVHQRPMGGLFGTIKTGKLSGHEEITRQALLITLQTLKAEGLDLPENEFQMILGDLDAEAKGVVGATSENAIIQGNYATDMPDAVTDYPVLNNSFRIEEEVRNYFLIPTNASAELKAGYRKARILFDKIVALGKVAQMKGVQAFFLKAVMQRFIVNHVDVVSPSNFGPRLNALNEFNVEFLKQVKAWTGDWHNNPEGQVTHFLRNYANSDKDSSLVSAKDTCENATQLMTVMTSEAISLWPVIVRNEKDIREAKNKNMSGPKLTRLIQTNANNRRLMYFIIGHVTHMIQDSFSGEHTLRAVESPNSYSNMEPILKTASKQQMQNNDLMDICFYGEAQLNQMGPVAASKTCYHKYLSASLGTAMLMIKEQKRGDFGDSIWTRGASVLEKSNEAGIKSRIKNMYSLTEALWPKYEDVEAAKAGDMEFVGVEKWTNINHNARLARAATAKYLYALATYLYGVQTQILKKKQSGGMKQLDPDFAQLKSVLKNEFFEGSPISLSTKKGLSRDFVMGQLSKSSIFFKVTDQDDGGKSFETRIRPIASIMSEGVFRCGGLKNESNAVSGQDEE